MRKLCMLLVDNDPDFLDSEAGAMTRRGYLVLKAASADEAKDLAEHNNVDLAVVDMRLQFDTEEHDTSGIKLCGELGHTIVCVLQTAYPVPQSEITSWRRQRILVAYVSKDQPVVRRRKTIAGVIQRDVRTHFGLDVSFNDRPEKPEDWSALASAIKPATEPVIRDDVSFVFHRLFPKSVESVNIFPVRHGAGGAGVVIADVKHAETELHETLIVKYGLNRGLKNERKNVEKYVMPLGPPGAAPMRWSASSRNLSATGHTGATAGEPRA